MATRKKDISFNLNENYTSEWFYLDDYNSIIDELTLLVANKNATGTLDGVVTFYQLIGDNEEEDFIDAHIFNLTTANDKQAISTNSDCMAIKFEYAKNNITGGTGRVSFTLSGK